MTSVLAVSVDQRRRGYPPIGLKAGIPALATALILAASGCATNGTGHRASVNGGQRPIQSGPSPDLNIAHDARVPLKRELMHFYKRWAGTPYRYGGESRAGVDCSSFVRQAIAAATRLQLPRSTRAQARVGTRIGRSTLEPGDLVFFKTGGGSRHVGVYLGNDRFMNASSSEGVTISRLDNVYWRQHYWQSRRLPLSDLESDDSELSQL